PGVAGTSSVGAAPRRVAGATAVAGLPVGLPPRFCRGGDPARGSLSGPRRHLLSLDASAACPLAEQCLPARGVGRLAGPRPPDRPAPDRQPDWYPRPDEAARR